MIVTCRPHLYGETSRLKVDHLSPSHPQSVYKGLRLMLNTGLIAGIVCLALVLLLLSGLESHIMKTELIYTGN